MEATGRYLRATDRIRALPPLHGELSPGSLAKHYTVDDRVEITCAPLRGAYV